MKRFNFSYLFSCLFGLVFMVNSHAAVKTFDYELHPLEVAKDTYIFEGLTEDFSVKNGGNIVNTGFIITKIGVIVIDTGVSKRYGEQQRLAISKITDKPIIRVYLTHHHPDHFLGNQAYSDVKIYALVDTINSMKAEGENFTSNMYRLVGDWMRGTKPIIPTQKAKEETEEIGGHLLQFLHLTGHTNSDLVIFDQSTGTLFVGDLVFNNRALTTPHANIEKWKKTLSQLQNIPFKVLVLGHGSITKDNSSIKQTADYLNWLVETIKQGASEGMDMNEVMELEIPKRFQSIKLVRDEFIRSVTHLFPKMEKEFLQPIK